MLRQYIDHIVVDVNEIERGIHRNPDAMRRLHLAYRQGGRLLRDLRERRRSTVNELVSRVVEYRAVPPSSSTCRLVDRENDSVEVQGRRSAPDLAGPVGNSRHNPYVVPGDYVRSNFRPAADVSGEQRRLYPFQYAVDNIRIMNEVEAEERGLRRPAVNVRRIASLTRAF